MGNIDLRGSGGRGGERGGLLVQGGLRFGIRIFALLRWVLGVCWACGRIGSRCGREILSTSLVSVARETNPFDAATCVSRDRAC